MPGQVDGKRARAWGLFRELVTVATEDRADRVKEIARVIWREPFTGRPWSELSFLVIGSALAGIGFAFVAITLGVGVILAITFFGLAIIALSVRGARGIGGLHRRLAWRFIDEAIEDPEPFLARPGFLGWLQSALRDRIGWRSMAYVALKVPLAVLGILVGFAAWWDAFFCLVYPVRGGNGNSPSVFGLPRLIFGQGFFSGGHTGFFYDLAIFCTGIVLFFAAPWAVRAVLYLDRRVMRVLLAPDALVARVRSLEQARAQTVDTSAATLRRIERDLHDGTQAQLVALAMRLGMAKEKLEDSEPLDIDQIRQLVGDAHRGAKEAIVELRDMARGIHPPALDTGLEGALSTLAARCTVPTELTLALTDRPTPAIEAIAYFCAAELLANVAQHARASRASVACSETRWVVADGRARRRRGRSAPVPPWLLLERIGRPDRPLRAVDGHLAIVSPPRGPTVVTVDLPLHA